MALNVHTYDPTTGRTKTYYGSDPLISAPESSILTSATTLEVGRTYVVNTNATGGFTVTIPDNSTNGYNIILLVGNPVSTLVTDPLAINNVSATNLHNLDGVPSGWSGTSRMKVELYYLLGAWYMSITELSL